LPTNVMACKAGTPIHGGIHEKRFPVSMGMGNLVLP
jgi:hypothetical protein